MFLCFCVEQQWAFSGIVYAPAWWLQMRLSAIFGGAYRTVLAVGNSAGPGELGVLIATRHNVLSSLFI